MKKTYEKIKKVLDKACFICYNSIRRECEGGGIGRRARLRGVWFLPYEFKSRSSHQ